MTLASRLASAAAASSVVVVGALNMDYLLTAAEMPGNDGSIPVDLVEAPGGHAGNCAAALTRLGIRATLLAAVGDDADGRAVLADLRSHGVDVGHVRVSTRSPTGRVVIPTTPTYRCMLMHRGANDDLTPADLDALPPAADAVVVFDPPRPVLDAVAAWVRRPEGRVPLYWTPGGLYSRPENLAALRGDIDVLVVNRDEARHLFHGGEPPAGPYRTVLTLGARGSRLYGSSRVLDVPAIPVRVGDATGAGDAFCAGLVLGRLADLAAADALRFANAVGALATRRPGARGSLPTLNEALAAGTKDPAR